MKGALFPPFLLTPTFCLSHICIWQNLLAAVCHLSQSRIKDADQGDTPTQSYMSSHADTLLRKEARLLPWPIFLLLRGRT